MSNKQSYYTPLFLKLLFALCFTTGVTIFSFSQKANKYHKQADKLYNKGSYEKAAAYYIQALAVDPKNDQVIAAFIPPGHKHSPKKIDDNPAYLTYQLAESFRQLKDYINAQKMYEQFFKFKMEGFYPLCRYWYAECLKNCNMPEAAEIEYDNFLKNHKEDDKFGLDAKVKLQESKSLSANIKNSSDQIIIKKLPFPINGNDNSFAFQRIDDANFIFSGIRPETVNKKVKYPIHIYSGSLKDSSIQKINIKGEQIDMAAASISPDQLTLYFTAWKTKTKNAIFTSSRKTINDAWETPTEMPAPINDKKYSTKHPFITGDGKYLLFSSDRSGTKGGFDIWYVEMQDGKPIGNATNAGSLINSKAEEVSPFYDTAQHVLYYASDRKGGIGGMDIYSSKGSLDSMNWNDPMLMPYPINTAKDETHYRRYANTDTAYLSSNRDFEMNLEVFSVVNYKRPPEQGILVQTTDKKEQPSVAPEKKSNVIAVIPVTEPTKSESELFVDSLNKTIEKRFNTYFDLNSSEIRDEDRNSLDEAIRMMKNDPSLTIVTSSFTDCKGKMAANKRTARRRARSVRRYLVKNGIDASRIITDYHAAEHYVIPCKDDSTYSKEKQLGNRRADIILTKADNPSWTPSGKEIDIDKIIESMKASKAKEKAAKSNERKAKKISAAAAKEKMLKNKKSDNLNNTNQKQKTTKEKATYNDSNNNNEWTEGKASTLPEMLARKQKEPIEIYTDSDSLTVDFYDNGVVDNDSISVIYNNTIVTKKEMLQASTSIHLTLKISADSSQNHLIVFAENLGKEPPNSALVIITDKNGKRTEVSVFSDLENNAVIHFIKGEKK